jgi:hypothetical protein
MLCEIVSQKLHLAGVKLHCLRSSLVKHFIKPVAQALQTCALNAGRKIVHIFEGCGVRHFGNP